MSDKPRKHRIQSASLSDKILIRNKDHGNEEYSVSAINQQSMLKKDHRRPTHCSEVRCGPQDQIRFCAGLSFDQELIAGTGGILEPLSRTAQNTDRIHGNVKLIFNDDLTQVEYQVYVYNALFAQNKVVGAHLHLGASNQNGPVVAFLFDGPAQNVNGLLASGIITNNDIIISTVPDAFNINNISSLYEGIRQGVIYTNVHTNQFPAGAIRGQIYFKTTPDALL